MKLLERLTFYRLRKAKKSIDNLYARMYTPGYDLLGDV